MTQRSQAEGISQQEQSQQGKLFGIPLGNLGWFASLLIGAAAGVVAFFATTCVGIFGIMIYNSATHASVDYAYSYQRGGLVVGILTLMAAWGYLGTLWVKRITRKG
jgi:uncharacterized membrane protein